jgi:DNA-binding response OmpR family regulator
MVDVLSRKPSILAVLPATEDRISLKSILRSSDWNVRFARPSRRIRVALDLGTVGVVLTDARLADGRTWKDVLQEIERTPNPPLLIVTDRLADEALWAEVLNLGGYDVLAKPFDEKEVLHAMTMACGARRKLAASFDPHTVTHNVRWSVA